MNTCNFKFTSTLVSLSTSLPPLSVLYLVYIPVVYLLVYLISSILVSVHASTLVILLASLLVLCLLAYSTVLPYPLLLQYCRIK